MAKVLTAAQILALMKRANPCNALKLTNSDEYVKVPYQDFFSAIDSVQGLTPVEKEGLFKLQDEMSYLLPNISKFHFHDDKLYIYFILRLQEVLGL